MKDFLKWQIRAQFLLAALLVYPLIVFVEYSDVKIFAAIYAGALLVGCILVWSTLIDTARDGRYIVKEKQFQNSLFIEILQTNPEMATSLLLAYIKSNALVLQRAFQRNIDAQNKLSDTEAPTETMRNKAENAEEEVGRLKTRFWQDRQAVLRILDHIVPAGGVSTEGLVLPTRHSECAEMDVDALVKEMFPSPRPIND